MPYRKIRIKTKSLN